MKKMIALFAGVLMTVSMLSFPVQAGLPEMNVEFNGKTIKMEQPPVIEHGRVLVPFKFFADTFGAKTSWDADTKTVTCTYGGTTISMTAYSQVMKLNGKNIAVEVPVDIVNDRVMVPIRVIATGFGANVSWDSNTRTAVITTGDVHFDRVNTAGNVSFTYAETASEDANIQASAKYPVFTGDFGSRVNTIISTRAKEDVKDFEKKCYETKDNSSKFVFTSDYEVKCNNEGVVSIVNTQKSSVGKENNTVVSARTYNIADGSILEISKDNVNMAAEKFKELINADKNNFLSGAENFLKAEYIGWYIDKDEKTVFFVSPGIIAPASQGAITVKVNENIVSGKGNAVIPSVPADKVISSSSVDLSKITQDKFFKNSGKASVAVNVPMIAGNYATVNTAIRNIATERAKAMADKYSNGVSGDNSASYSGTITLSVSYADENKICILISESIKSEEKLNSNTVSALCVSTKDGSVVDNGTDAALKAEGAVLINEAIKNDKTGAFINGAVAKAEDVGYYYAVDGTVFFVNEGVVAPASSGIVTVEKLN